MDFALIFDKSKHLGVRFAQGFYPDFNGFCPDFRQIKTFGGALAPSSPTPLLHVMVAGVLLHVIVERRYLVR